MGLSSITSVAEEAVVERVYTILMVEDDQNHYKILQRYIDKSGLNVQLDHVTTAQECFTIFLKKNYDMLVLDYNLDKYTGLEILRKLHELKVLVPIIMVTQEKDPKIAIEAMKLGAVDFIYKSKESFKVLPKKIVQYIDEFEHKVAHDDFYQVKRRNLLKNSDVREVLRAILRDSKKDLQPISNTTHSYNPELPEELVRDDEKLERVLQLLTLNRVLDKKPVGVKVSCPRCEADNVTTFPVCPECNGKLFVKNVKNNPKEKPFKCLGGCGQTFDEAKFSFKCNQCGRQFTQTESKYKHTFTFRINRQILDELERAVLGIDEVEMWEERSQKVNEEIENTKEIHKEIQSQLKALIEFQLKSKRG